MVLAVCKLKAGSVPAQMSPWHGKLDQLFPWMPSQVTVVHSTHFSSDSRISPEHFWQTPTHQNTMKVEPRNRKLKSSADQQQHVEAKSSQCKYATKTTNSKITNHHRNRKYAAKIEYLKPLSVNAHKTTQF